MLSFNKRKRFLQLISLIVCVILSSMFFACNKDNGKGEEGDNFPSSGLVVKYLDVGEGDATLIRLPDGKVMLFDTGAPDSKNSEKILSSLKGLENKIDYLVLSHPDKEHYGNALEIINKVAVKKAFIPKITDSKIYPDFTLVANLLNEKGIEVEYNATYLNLSSDDYRLIFLYPDMTGDNSPYFDFSLSNLPNDKLADELSPIIYLEYLGVRFIFTADASKTAENIVLNNYKLGLYDNLMPNEGKLSLENIDFYKFSSHGDNSGNSMEFLSLLSPKNAIISVGGGNGKGHPSTISLSNLYEANKDYTLYRTDRDRTIVVHVENNGKYNITKEK